MSIEPETQEDSRQRRIFQGARDLGAASRELADEVSLESDTWFRASLQVAGRTMAWAEQQVVVFALSLASGLWPGPRRPRERLHLLLRKEAERARGKVAAEDLDLFTEKMAILIDLVLSGSIGVQDVAFESAESPAPSVAPGELQPGPREAAQAQELAG